MSTSALRSMTFAALVLASGRAAAQCPDGTPPPCATPRRAVAALAVPSPDARARRFMLLPFRNVTRTAAQDWIVTGAPLMLGESLGQFHDLTVVTEEKLSAARRRLSIRADSMPDAAQLRRLAEETGGWTAISGNVYAIGPRLRITVQAVDVPTARVIMQDKTEIAIDADVRQAFDSLTVLLVAPTGVRGTRADLAALTTRSSDAYRAYVRGIDLDARSAYVRAQQAFSEAVALDSTFALAWSHLAYSTVNANIWTMMDPASPAIRAIEQSARLGTRLPARQLEYIRAMQNYVHGQIRRARTSLDSLALTDRDDLDTRVLLSGLLLNDPGLDVADGTMRLSASMNHAMQLAREVLERDPGRRSIYNVFAMGYGMAGGWWMGGRAGLATELGSFVATMFRMLDKGPDASFIPVLRDSLVLVPSRDFLRLPGAERARLRRRSADAGMEWVERWLLLGPRDAEAHLWASRLAELRDDAPRALRELVVAESLGVESAWENLPQRRLELLVRAERVTAAAALADSLSRAGVLARQTLVPYLDRGRGYGVAALLLNRRWTDAGALLTSLGRTRDGHAQCVHVAGELSTATGEVSGAALRALADTVAHNLMAVAAVQPLAPCLGTLVLLVNDSTAGRRRFAGAALLAVADSLQRAGGNEASAFQAAAWAWTVDTTQHAAIAQRPWFAARMRTVAFGRHFRPDAATVDGDSVVFGFRVDPSAPTTTAGANDSTAWKLRIGLPGWETDGAVSLQLTIGATPNGSAATGGSVLARLASMEVRRTDLFPLVDFQSPSSASMRLTPEGFVVVARGAFVDELRRLRATTASFLADSCFAERDGLCSLRVIPLVYR